MSAPRTQSTVSFTVRAVENGYIIQQGGDPSRCEAVTALVARSEVERDALVIEILDTLLRRV